MFHKITHSHSPVLKRLWLHLGEYFAAKNSNRWPVYAAKCDLDQFRSFVQSGKTYFTYAGIPIGETLTEHSRLRENTLSPFMDSLRMVVAAYERSIRLGDQVRQGVVPICPPIMLTAVELEMLFAHPQYLALQAEQEAEDIFVGLKLSENSGELYSFYAGADRATA